EVAWQRKTQSEQSEAESGGEFKKNHEELPGLVHLQKRAPERLERPGDSEEAGGEGNHFIAHTGALIKDERHQADGIERQTLGKVEGGHPSCGRSVLAVI